MNYSDAINFLYALQQFGAILGLDSPRKLAALAGNPQNQLRFIHVAGTNGKGSTCAMLESIYGTTGLRVGLFTSPHLVSFRERIQVNREFISEADVARLAERMQPWLATLPAEQHPTFFEVVTVLALMYFAEQKCDLVIWETGLGGRLDATNIVMPLASVITNVQFDHQQWLGDTLPKIAAEKAGIIKAGVPVITAAEEPEVLKVIEAIARKNNAPLYEVGVSGQTIPLPLLGGHQQLNAALAIKTVEVLRSAIPVADEAVRHGLETVRWAGRLQVVKTPQGRMFLLDGAHNEAGAEALRVAWQQHFPGTNAALILGVLGDKNWQGLCDILAPLTGRILTVPVSSSRTATAATLAEGCQRANPQAEVTACDSLAQALEKLGDAPLVVIAGSLYLVGEAVERLGAADGDGPNERGLNEYSAGKTAQRPV